MIFLPTHRHVLTCLCWAIFIPSKHPVYITCTASQHRIWHPCACVTWNEYWREVLAGGSACNRDLARNAVARPAADSSPPARIRAILDSKVPCSDMVHDMLLNCSEDVAMSFLQGIMALTLVQVDINFDDMALKLPGGKPSVYINPYPRGVKLALSAAICNRCAVPSTATSACRSFC